MLQNIAKGGGGAATSITLCVRGRQYLQKLPLNVVNTTPF